MRTNLILILYFVLPIFLQGQQFEFHSSKPFGIDYQGGESIPLKSVFLDIDNDLDFDLLTVSLQNEDPSNLSILNFKYDIALRENIGDRNNPIFSAPIPYMEDLEKTAGLFFPSFGDINNDGLLDVVACSEINSATSFQTLQVYIKNQQGIMPAYDIQSSEVYDLISFPPNSILNPELVDLDQDGDLDILISGTIESITNAEEDNGVVLYAKNIGDPITPNFLGWFYYPYGLNTAAQHDILKAGDLDNDGDLDIISIRLDAESNRSYLLYQENIAQMGDRPNFSAQTFSPFGLPESSENFNFFDPNLVDIDNDGDNDFFIVGGEFGDFQMLYYENGSCAVSTEVSLTICEGDAYEGYFASGTYTDSFYTSNGCDSVRTLHLTVLPELVTFDDVSICQGENISIGDTILYQSGNYEIILESSMGCDSTIYFDLTVIALDTTIQVIENTLLANPNLDSYQWINCDNGQAISGANNNSYSASETGSYAVELSFMGCTEISKCYEVILSAVNNEDFSTAIEIFPNPASDILNIKNSGKTKIDNCAIYNFKGQMIHDEVMRHSAISVKNWQEGVYILFIESEGKTALKTFSVIR